MGSGPQNNFETPTGQQPKLKALQNGGNGEEGERGGPGTQYYLMFVCEGLAECMVCRHPCSWGPQSECHRPGGLICVTLLSSGGNRAISGPVSQSLCPADDSFAILKLTGHQKRALPTSNRSLLGLLEHCNNIQGSGLRISQPLDLPGLCSVWGCLGECLLNPVGICGRCFHSFPAFSQY